MIVHSMRCCTATKNVTLTATLTCRAPGGIRDEQGTHCESDSPVLSGWRPTWRPPNEENRERRAARRAPAISLATSPGALISEAPTNQPAPTAGQWAVDPTNQRRQPASGQWIQWVLWAASGSCGQPVGSQWPVASGSKQQWIQRRQSHTPQRLPTRALMTRSDLRTSSDLDPKALEPRLKGYRGST